VGCKGWSNFSCSNSVFRCRCHDSDLSTRLRSDEVVTSKPEVPSLQQYMGWTCEGCPQRGHPRLVYWPLSNHSGHHPIFVSPATCICFICKLNVRGIQLATYDATKHYLASLRASNKPTQLDFFFCGAFAGSTAQTVAFPIELIRRRMQTQGFTPGASATDAKKYRNFLHCLFTVVREEGFLALYRGKFALEGIRFSKLVLNTGLAPNYLKIIPACGTQFLAFEGCKQLMGMPASGKI